MLKRVCESTSRRLLALSDVHKTLWFTDPAGRKVLLKAAAQCSSLLQRCEGCLLDSSQQGSHADLTLTLPQRIAQRLPLLKDLWSSTLSQQEGTPGQEEKSAPFDAPCPLWALGALVIVLERTVNLWAFFGGQETTQGWHQTRFWCAPQFCGEISSSAWL